MRRQFKKNDAVVKRWAGRRVRKKRTERGPSAAEKAAGASPLKQAIDAAREREEPEEAKRLIKRARKPLRHARGRK